MKLIFLVVLTYAAGVLSEVRYSSENRNFQGVFADGWEDLESIQGETSQIKSTKNSLSRISLNELKEISQEMNLELLSIESLTLGEIELTEEVEKNISSLVIPFHYKVRVKRPRNFNDEYTTYFQLRDQRLLFEVIGYMNLETMIREDFKITKSFYIEISQFSEADEITRNEKKNGAIKDFQKEFFEMTSRPVLRFLNNYKEKIFSKSLKNVKTNL